MRNFKNLTYIGLTISLVLNISNMYSQETRSQLPSEQTWAEIQTKPILQNNIESSTNPSLRAAPPDGPSIGETPIIDSSIKGLILIGLIYFIFKFKRIYYLWDEQ